MFKKQKNEFWKFIQEANFNPELFEAKEEGREFIISLRNSPLEFRIIPTNSGRRFDCKYTRFPPESSIKSFLRFFFNPIEGIERTQAKYKIWLQQDIKDYLEEQATPDFWEQGNFQEPFADNKEQFFSGSIFNEQETSNFSDEEKAQLRLALSEFRLLIKKNFNPTKEQMNIITERLDYLSDALDRLNRFDWKSILISSTVSISVALSLDTARGKLLFDLLKQALTNLMNLLQ